MVYSPTGSSDLILIRGCMTSSFLYLSFSTLYSSSLWRGVIIIVSKLNKPPAPSNGLEINKPPGGLNRRFTVFSVQYFRSVPPNVERLGV